jgi:S1-C subfamily serine protease
MASNGKRPSPALLVLILAALILVSGAAGLGIGASAPGPQTASPTPAERSDLIRSIVASSVKVILGQEDQEGAVSEAQSSSGVVIYSEAGPKPWSLVLTNAHAVNGAGLAGGPGVYVSYVVPTGRRILRATVAARSDQESVDLALVRLEGVALSAAQFEAMDQVQLGSPVLVASSPFGRELSLTSGIVSQLYLSGPPAIERATCNPQEKFCLDPKPLEEIFKTDAPICYGSSGGGVFLTATGRLVGLVESYQTADIVFRPKSGEEYKIQIPVPGESFLISVNKIKYFLERHGFGLDGPKVLLTSAQES